MNEIKFIHAADLHLDSPFIGMRNVPEEVFEKVYNSTFTAFSNLIQEAVHRQVDFVLLVGDLFDEARQSLRAQIQLRNGFNQLKDANIDVFLSYGNHDYLRGNHYHVHYPGNVHVFPSEQVSSFSYKKAGKHIANIYGFSYEQRKVTTNKAKEYMVQNRQEVPFHIAMLHGSIENNEEHDTYAPFRLNDLKQEPFDYWALGHIHKRTILSREPYIVYPGNIQGRHIKETGSKGFYEVTLNETETKLQFVPTQLIQFAELELDMSKIKDLLQLEERLKMELKQFQHQFTLVQLYLNTNSSTHHTWEETEQLMELIELINESNIEKETWIYIYNYKFRVNNEPVLIDDLKSNPFIKDILYKLEHEAIRPRLNEAYNNRRLRKVMEKFTDEDIKDIRKQAETYLLNKLRS